MPVCSTCRKPLEMVVYSEDGIEALGYQCLHCGHPPSVFLLAYLDDPEDTLSNEAALAAPRSAPGLHLSTSNS